MNEAAGGISRRRVVVGTAWLTPAIVLAVAVPRAAASGSTLIGDYLVFYGPQVSNGSNNTVDASFELGVQVGSQNPLPAGSVLVTHWIATLYVGSPEDNVVFGEPESGDLAIALYGNSDVIGALFTAIPAGDYTVILSATADPYLDPASNDYYQAMPIDWTQTVTVTDPT